MKDKKLINEREENQLAAFSKTIKMKKTKVPD